MRRLVIYNPAAGKKEAYRKIQEQIRAYCQNEGLPLEEALTEYPGHAGEITEQAAQTGEPVRIYGVGGDGTLCEIAGAAACRENVQVGIFPVGSGNDYIRTFGAQGQFLQVEAQMNARPVKVDMIKTEKMLSLNLCSAGLDAAVALHMAKFKKLPLVSGPMAYNLALIKCVLGKMGSNLTVTIDGHPPIQGNFMFALAGSGQYYGGGYRGAPQADPSDGLLDFVLIRKMGRLRLVKLLPEYKQGKHLESKAFQDILIFMRGKRMEITCDESVVVNFDGECQPLTQISFEVIPRALNFLVPDFKNQPKP